MARNYILESASLALHLAILTPPVLAAPCDTPAHRAFDFWLGHWEVRTPDGKLAGVNRIDREYGVCVLHERYATETELQRREPQCLR